MVLDGVGWLNEGLGDKLFTGPSGLILHQRVQIFTDACEVNEPATMSVPFPAQNHRLHLSFRHQIVESAPLDPEQALHIPPPSKFRKRRRGGGTRIQTDLLGRHGVHICHTIRETGFSPKG